MGFHIFRIQLAEVEQELEGIVANLEVIRVSPIKFDGNLRTFTFLVHKHLNICRLLVIFARV